SRGADTGMVDDVMALLAEDRCSASMLDRGVAGLASELLAPDALSRIAAQIGPYRIKRVLGQGGMGVVYLAERVELGKLVAIKLLSDAALSPARLERFAGEQQMLSQLEHPAIARLYDRGVLDDGVPFFVMEYVDGIPLTEHCRARGATI